jgi:flagellar biosynthesis protein FlhG
VLDDQAQGLRKLFVRGAAPVCAIGGTGIESAVLAIAEAFASAGDRVLLIDRSRGAIAACAGKRARHELWHVLEGDVAIDDALIAVRENLALLPAARGIDLLAADSRDWRDTIAATLGTSHAPYDVWFVHGLPPSDAGCDAPLFTVTPSRASVTQVYAQIKALATAQGRSSFGIVVAGVHDDTAAAALFDGLAATARRFLGVELGYCGALPMNARGSVVAGSAVAMLRMRIAAAFVAAREPSARIAA